MRLVTAFMAAAVRAAWAAGLVSFWAVLRAAAALLLVVVFAFALGLAAGAALGAVELIGHAVGDRVGFFFGRLVGVRHFAATLFVLAAAARAVLVGLALDSRLLALHDVGELVGEQAVALLRAGREFAGC